MQFKIGDKVIANIDSCSFGFKTIIVGFDPGINKYIILKNDGWTIRTETTITKFNLLGIKDTSKQYRWANPEELKLQHRCTVCQNIL